MKDKMSQAYSLQTQLIPALRKALCMFAAPDRHSAWSRQPRMLLFFNTINYLNPMIVSYCKKSSKLLFSLVTWKFFFFFSFLQGKISEKNKLLMTCTVLSLHNVLYFTSATDFLSHEGSFRSTDQKHLNSSIK